MPCRPEPWVQTRLVCGTVLGENLVDGNGRKMARVFHSVGGGLKQGEWKAEARQHSSLSAAGLLTPTVPGLSAAFLASSPLQMRVSPVF